MIVFDLICDQGHRFEGWFGSSGDFADQQESGLLACPHCASAQVSKAPMAPAVPRKGSGDRQVQPAHAPVDEKKDLTNGPIPAEVHKALTALAQAQAKALEKSTWVGDKFAEKSRAMHYGEAKDAPIHGSASAKEAQGLIEEGIAVAPLPFPVAPPEKLN